MKFSELSDGFVTADVTLPNGRKARLTGGEETIRRIMEKSGQAPHTNAEADSSLPLPVMNFGDDEPNYSNPLPFPSNEPPVEPPPNYVGAATPGPASNVEALPLPVMNFGGGETARDTGTHGQNGPSPDHTQNNATDGDVGSLPLPSMEY